MRIEIGAAMLAAVMIAGVTSASASGQTLPHKQVGKASFYSNRFQGRHMANGERFNVHSNAAASKTLPIGTKARVTDLQTGKSAIVTIKDRGPVPKGRVVDLTPATAKQIGLTPKQGIAPVAVVPTALPPRTETASTH
ncbi:septal ring lytic transglycosylase RlpA family protein [Lichenicoccus roseus]|uniref:Endolytic peptidoglycan transglycosylase RlpA n=1 Tax=Lichenicoccus roseus TaxID=2683649 RepID=A0A5R9J4H9_9PROT|nr:septal ring lytic transglycosylase RlpA family protein [Lichenicoccus roseus]TLU72462.1 septal ring lytic transglycosylase RlpA family protein [Lichenicoccus roseus]